MKRLQSYTQWSTVRRAGALAMAVAAGLFATANAQPSLAVLNGGPSSASVPTAANSPVLTVLWPREVVDTSITDIDAITGGNQLTLTLPLAEARSVQQSGSTTSGLRLRSRGVFDSSASGRNANSQITLVGITPTAVVSANSYILFLQSSNPNLATYTTIGALETAFGTANGAAPGGAGQQAFAKYALTNANFAGINNNTTAVQLAAGAQAITLAALDAATPSQGSLTGGGAGNNAAGAWKNGGFDLAIVVLDNGGTSAGEIASEFFYIRNPATSVRPTSAATTLNGTNQITQLALVTNLQLRDDDTNNTADTGAIATSDLFIQPNSTGPVQSLASYIGTLTGPPVAGAITLGGTSNANYNRIITVPFATPIAAADAPTVQASRIGFGGASQVFGVSGEGPETVVGNYATLGAAAPLTIASTRLLQGSGPVANAAAASEIWFEVNASDTVAINGDNNQFLLTNAAGTIIARSNLVQAALPTVVQVPGINDTNLDGTTTDPITTATGTRVFARFELGTFANNDPAQAFTVQTNNDAINSDVTWSDEGRTNFRNRKVRSAFTLTRNSAAVNFLQSSLGGNLSAATSVTPTSAARPILIAMETRANGSVTGITNANGAIVDQIAFVFDTTVTTPTQNRFAYGYNPAVTINDLSAGLLSNFNLRTATTANAATFANRVFTTAGFAAATTFISNDSVVINSNPLPLTANAADGTLAATGIRPGTGFVGGNSPFFGAINNNAVTANTLGSVLTTGATFTANVLTAFTNPTTVGRVNDGAPAGLVAANTSRVDANGNIDRVLLGLSEAADDTLGAGDTEAESFLSINDKTTAANRISLKNIAAGTAAQVDFNGTNQALLKLDTLTGAGTNPFLPKTVTEGYEVRLFNPGFPLNDTATPANDVVPTVARNRPVNITAPGVQFAPQGAPTGRATVDSANKVITIQLKTTQAAALNSGGSTTTLLNRFFVRGRTTVGTGAVATGTPQTIPGQFANVTFTTTAGTDNLFTMTLTFVASTPFLQEDFTIEYVDRTNLTYTPQTDSWLVGTAGGEVPSATIPVEVIRAATQTASGNPIGMTIAGTVNLGTGNDATGTKVRAFLFSPVRGNATVTFTYKGVTYTGTLASYNATTQTELLVDGAVYYFHPQLKGAAAANGTLAPQGVLNLVPDLDLSATFQTIRNDGTTTGATNQTFAYQNLNGLTNVVQPIAVTFRRDTTNPNRLTLTGAGISNGSVTLIGAFVDANGNVTSNPIAEAVVTGAAATNGARPYTLHVPGRKEYAGRSIVITVCPDNFFAPGVRNFMANNLLVNRVPFSSDFNRTGANAGPVIFDVDAGRVVEIKLEDYALNNWVILPVVTDNAGSDFATAGNAPANRLQQSTSTGTPPVTTTTFVNGATPATFPANTNASGAFLLFDVANCRPQIIETEVVLAVDDRGVYCGPVGGLNRFVAGYSYAVLYKSSPNAFSWFSIGRRISSIGSGATAAFLRSVANATNGGWTLGSNLRNNVVAANAFPGSGSSAAGVVIVMNNKDGVRIGGNSVSTNPNFVDLTSIPANTGVLFNQTQPTLTQSAQ